MGHLRYLKPKRRKSKMNGEEETLREFAGQLEQLAN